MHAYPANKAIAQVKQCRIDGLLFQMLSFGIMQAIAGGESCSVCRAWICAAAWRGPGVLPRLGQGAVLTASAPTPAPSSAV